MSVHRLSAPPRLPLVLARGALGSAAKRGRYGGARLPDERLVLSAARVDPARLDAYTRVCGAGAARSGAPGPAEGEGATALPPGYPHLLGFPLAMRLMAARAFPYPLLGLVHTGIELTRDRTLTTADRPEITVYAEGPRAHRRGSQFDMVTEARLEGELVWHSRSSYLCRHRTEQQPPSDGVGPDVGEEGAVARPPAPLPVRAHWDLPSDLGRRYAAASGDRNPIHLHPLTAKLFGFPRHIAHGMWTFARCLAETGAGAGAERLTARAEFKAPVLLPSTVAFGSSPVGVDGTEGAVDGHVAPGTRHFELRGGADGERLHLTGEVTSGSPA